MHRVSHWSDPARARPASWALLAALCSLLLGSCGGGGGGGKTAEPVASASAGLEATAGSGAAVPVATPASGAIGGSGDAAAPAVPAAPAAPVAPVAPSASATDATLARQYEASHFLQQASFGPTPASIEHVATIGLPAWLAEQMAMPAVPDFVNHVQAKYNLGNEYRPNGSKYTPLWLGQKFWATAAQSPDQLRKRTAYALHHIFMVSQADAALYHHTRGYAHYLDTLNRLAFGNFRELLEEVALSPVMGIYLSHMRNRKEDVASGRSPDENFARELMQLFTIGLVELNTDGSARRDAEGNPIETYTNDDVMALAKVFTGFSWALPDHQLSEGHFLYGWPDTSAAGDQQADVRRMRAYPGLHSTSVKRLFAGKPHAVTIAAHTPAADSLRIALDALHAHPNVGPFIGRQLIQRLTVSNPTTAYVARVAAVFNNNGRGVRGDLGAVVRAVLLDSEARAASSAGTGANGSAASPSADLGRLREPVLRITHWMRAFGATSVSGEYTMAPELEAVSQRALHAPSVFGYFRTGYVPPNTRFSAAGATAPEFQIVNESTTAAWVNTAATMVGMGLGGTGAGQDVVASLAAQAALAAGSDGQGLLSSSAGQALVQNLNLLLFAGRMSADLQRDVLDAAGAVAPGSTAALNRARVAVLVAMASPEYLAQR